MFASRIFFTETDHANRLVGIFYRELGHPIQAECLSPTAAKRFVRKLQNQGYIRVRGTTRKGGAK